MCATAGKLELDRFSKLYTSPANGMTTDVSGDNNDTVPIPL